MYPTTHSLLSTIYHSLSVVGCMLWVTVTYVVDHMLPTVYSCCPQHVSHNIYLVVHNIWSLYMLWGVCCGYSCLCCGIHVHECCPQYIVVVHNTWYVVENIARFSFVTHNIHPQHIIVVHHIHPPHMYLICCGCMLWVAPTYVVENVWWTYVVDNNEFYRWCIMNCKYMYILLLT